MNWNCPKCGSPDVIIATTPNGFGSWKCNVCNASGAYPHSHRRSDMKNTYAGPHWTGREREIANRVITALMIVVLLAVGMLLASVAHAGPADDALAAAAFAASTKTPATNQCLCTSPADCSCDGRCGCANCSALEWRRYADGDTSRVWLYDAKTGRAVGDYEFAGHCFQRVTADGKTLDGVCRKPPVAVPANLSEVPVPAVITRPVYPPQTVPVSYNAPAYQWPMPMMMGDFSGNCVGGG